MKLLKLVIIIANAKKNEKSFLIEWFIFSPQQIFSSQHYKNILYGPVERVILILLKHKHHFYQMNNLLEYGMLFHLLCLWTSIYKLIAKKALKSGKPVILLLNKSDIGEALPLEEFYSLGIKNPLRVSATTGLHLNELRDSIDRELSILGFNLNQKEQKNNALKIALIGRPNVGKSSLFNSLAKKQQAIVANLSGTTRDINRTELKYKGQTIELLDTAGLRKPGKREVGIEKFSALRSLAAIEEADVCCLLIDSTEPHSKLDQTLAGEITKAGKGIILVVTKTDLEHKDSN